MRILEKLISRLSVTFNTMSPLFADVPVELTMVELSFKDIDFASIMISPLSPPLLPTVTLD